MILDISDLDTQSDAMGAVDMMIQDYEEGSISGIEFIMAIKAINTEWKQ